MEINLTISLTCLILALGYYLYRGPVQSLALRLSLGIGAFSLTLLYTLYYIANYFTGAGINYAVIYHLHQGFSGAPIFSYPRLSMVSGSIFLTGILATLWLVINRQTARPNPLPAILTGGLLLLALVFHPVTAAYFDHYYNTQNYSSQNHSYLENLYESPAIQQIAEPKNLILIYAESLERTYFDESTFPDLLPNLRQFKDNSLDFTDIWQLPPSGHTIGGLVASQCGIILTLPSRPKTGEAQELKRDGRTSFLPGAKCLGDLLNQAGYHLSYYGGADLEFGSKRAFFHTHHFDEIYGVNELRLRLSDPYYLNPWGLYDDSLLNIAFADMEQLAIKSEPFAMFLLTLDTHHPKGHPSASCQGLEYDDGSNQILNAIACSDYLITRFIKKIRASEFSENTVIAVVSDHLAHQNTATPLLETQTRRNLFLINSPSLETHREINSPGLLLDVGPTLMPHIGFNVQLAFGRNLNTPDKPYPQPIRFLDLEQFIKEMKIFSNRFWYLE